MGAKSTGAIRLEELMMQELLAWAVQIIEYMIIG